VSSRSSRRDTVRRRLLAALAVGVVVVAGVVGLSRISTGSVYSTDGASPPASANTSVSTTPASVVAPALLPPPAAGTTSSSASASQSAAANPSQTLPTSPTTPATVLPAPSVPKLDDKLLVAAGVPGASVDVTGDVPRIGDDGVHVVVSGPDSAAAVAAAGGSILAQAGGRTSAVVPSDALLDLAASSAVSAVQAPIPPVEDAVVDTSQAMVASGASAWLSSGWSGDGVRIGIVDAGFGNLAGEALAGNLPSGLGVAGNYCGSSLNSSDHGTAVAEVIHQLAPYAQLTLYCVADSTGFTQAEQAIVAAGITLVNSSLAFPGDARGDGSPLPGSAAAAVNAAAAAGVLWVQSAGNYGQSHLAGTLSAGQALTVLEQSAIPRAGSVVLQWDQWSSAQSAVQLCIRLATSTGAYTCASASGGIPVAYLSVSSASYTVAIQTPVGMPAPVHFDVTYFGDGTSTSLYATSAGSVTSPASAPGALAVGAICRAVRYCAGLGAIEPFSSQGPTIDGRVKPDIAGYDGLGSNLSDLNPFYGTSAAAPSVVGAAALVMEANPSFGAPQVRAFLLNHANAGRPNAPPTLQTGAGALSVGATPTYPLPPSGRAANLCATAAAQAGFSGNALIVAVAIALDSSRCDPTTANSAGIYGLWQITAAAHPDYPISCLMDPWCSASAAWALSAHGADWSAWPNYSTGAYSAVLDAAQSAVNSLSQPSQMFEFQGGSGNLWRSTGVPCLPIGCVGWSRVDNNPMTTSVYAGGGGLFEFQSSTGALFKWLGTDCSASGCPGWVRLDENPATTAIVVGVDGVYEFQASTGNLWRYTGTSCSATMCSGWSLLDSNPSTKTVVAGPTGLFEFQSGSGALYQWTGTDCSPGCTGWAQLDNNPATTAIAASAAGPVEFQAANGRLWRYTGMPCSVSACSGWSLIDSNPATSSVVAGVSGILEYQISTGALWQWTGTDCTPGCSGWTLLDINRSANSVFVGTAGVYEFVGGTGELRRYTGPVCGTTSCTGWSTVDDNPATTKVISG
jgi:hypothetical protein